MKAQDNVMNWLLEDSNPPVRYLTFTNILDKAQSSSDVKHATALCLPGPGFYLFAIFFKITNNRINLHQGNFHHRLPLVTLSYRVSSVLDTPKNSFFKIPYSLLTYLPFFPVFFL